LFPELPPNRVGLTMKDLKHVCWTVDAQRRENHMFDTTGHS
jgi:hypothetical protein